MDLLLRRALVGTAGALQLLASELGVKQLREFDLKAALRRCLQVQVQGPVDAELSGSAPVGFKGVSTVDLVVPSPRSPMWRAALELKWWSGKNKVAECLWDAFKIASLYRQGRTESGYLVAAGPESLWAEPLAALFTEARVWQTRQLRADFPGAYREILVKGPPDLPAGIRTVPIEEVPIHLAGGPPWLLRAVRVSTTSGTVATDTPPTPRPAVPP
jgi:hypothetical protein